MFVVLATNTNQDNTVYGPFDSEEDAATCGFDLNGSDHLHSHHVMEVVDPPKAEEIEDEEVHEPSKDELMARAAELEITGRSSMNKDELTEAIAAAESEEE